MLPPMLPSILADAPEAVTLALLVVAVGLALAFEFVNGFHDTANAVATVIYTRTLPATPAVLWSGAWNLVGVLTSSGMVAFAIVGLLPPDLVLGAGSATGLAMVFSLLASAIAWNLGTWRLGLPASSSHALIGSVLGVGLANAALREGGSPLDGVNWQKAGDVMLALLFSPLVGFALSAFVLLAFRVVVRSPRFFEAPAETGRPPRAVRAFLVATCTGVSFAHGSNDGQKGMGLIVLILAGLLPGAYALRPATDAADLAALSGSATRLATSLRDSTAAPIPPDADADRTLAEFLRPTGRASDAVVAALAEECAELSTILGEIDDLDDLAENERLAVRTDLFLVGRAFTKLDRSGMAPVDETYRAERKSFSDLARRTTDFIPPWVKIAVALALGVGTTVGYRRIVRTIGEKIGKEHLTYAQGAAAEAVAAVTILAGDRYGLPISTTHVLASGVAGTMAANRSGVQGSTIRNIVLAWVLTLPVCVFLGAALFAAALYAISLAGM